MSDWLRRVGAGIDRFADRIGDKIEDAAKDVAAGVSRVAAKVNSAVNKDYVVPLDGFVAYDRTSGALLGGKAPGVSVRDALPGQPRGAPEILASGDSNEPVRFRAPGSDIKRTTGKNGGAEMPLSALGPAIRGLPPKRGGVVPVSAEAEGQTVTSRVLALPKDYDGPIFVSDIDETLRMTEVKDVLAGKEMDPLPGSKEILHGVAAKGVPIVYLSAGARQIAQTNHRFLDKHMPAGVLLDNPGFGFKNLTPDAATSARLQAEHKSRVLAELKAAYPNAQLFGLGDDKWGDAVAYHKAGAKAYIHDVRPGDENIPAGFSGVKTGDYNPAFRARIFSDIDAAIAKSNSFKP